LVLLAQGYDKRIVKTILLSMGGGIWVLICSDTRI
jgi:hypothetical protein